MDRYAFVSFFLLCHFSTQLTIFGGNLTAFTNYLPIFFSVIVTEEKVPFFTVILPESAVTVFKNFFFVCVSLAFIFLSLKGSLGNSKLFPDYQRIWYSLLAVLQQLSLCLQSFHLNDTLFSINYPLSFKAMFPFVTVWMYNSCTPADTFRSVN